MLAALQARTGAEVAAQACQGVFVVEGRPTREQRDIRLLDPDTGADKTLRVDWDSALHIQPLRTRARPCGYWLAPQSRWNC